MKKKKVNKPKTEVKKSIAKIRSSKVPVVVELPINAIDMETYVEDNRVMINEMLIKSFDYAVRKNFTGAEVFCFKNSNYIVVVNQKDFKDNVQNIFDYSLKNEHFEVCAKAKKVIELIDKFSFVLSYKKIKPK
jgi:hypothetical protein